MFACVRLREPAPVGPPPSPAADALVTLAHDHSPRVEIVAGDLAVLDAHGITRLFGGPGAFARQLHDDAARRGLAAAVGVASTRTAAMAVAIARTGVTVVPRGRESPALSSLPLATLLQLDDEFDVDPAPKPRRATGASRHYRLAPSPETGPGQPSPALALATLERWGLETLGDLAALPADRLFARLGPLAWRWQRLARGEDRRPLAATAEAFVFARRLALEWPIEGIEPLSFVLARLLEPMGADLERHDRGAVVLHVWLKLVTREVHHRALHLPAPMRDPKVLRTLALLDLERHPPSAGVDEVCVDIEVAPGRVAQGSLLARPLPTPDALATLLARLTALMGEGRCGTPRLLDTFRPGACRVTAFAPEGGSVAPRTGRPQSIRTAKARRTRRPPTPVRTLDLDNAPPPRAPRALLRRFRRPLAARVRLESGRPARMTSRAFAGLNGGIVSCAGPWRTSGEWWASAGRRPRHWEVDEWDVALADGTVCRLHHDRAVDRWTVGGVWD